MVRYLPRRIRVDDTNEGMPDLAQMDDNLTVSYRYASDDDARARPTSPRSHRRFSRQRRPFLLERIGTTSTGQVALRATLPVTLPSSFTA